jgi:hypothetical protein
MQYMIDIYDTLNPKSEGQGSKISSQDNLIINS